VNDKLSTIKHYSNLFKVLKKNYNILNRSIPISFDDKQSYYINFDTIGTTIFNKPKNFKEILLDTNDFCNLQCVYCHNGRSKSKVSIEDFNNFLLTQVASVDNFQIGCGMEPTADMRLLEFVKIIYSSHARPKKIFRLQTNGTLIHRHNIEELYNNGINNFTISIDSLNLDIHRQQRDNSDLSQILINIKSIKEKCKKASIHFITTVTSKSVDTLEDLILYAIDSKIKLIELRQMFYKPYGKDVIKDHNKMKSLVIDTEIFKDKCSKLKEKYKNKILIFINDELTLDQTYSNTKFGTDILF
jgi:MoaA/NifB/PqqE/SkfB family radical SAM enzyme